MDQCNWDFSVWNPSPLPLPVVPESDASSWSLGRLDSSPWREAQKSAFLRSTSSDLWSAFLGHHWATLFYFPLLCGTDSSPEPLKGSAFYHTPRWSSKSTDRATLVLPVPDSLSPQASSLGRQAHPAEGLWGSQSRWMWCPEKGWHGGGAQRYVKANGRWWGFGLHWGRCSVIITQGASRPLPTASGSGTKHLGILSELGRFWSI